ncbi:TetR/AcrR family transcriptional regulator [Rhodococcus fascians]|nr:TetR/AcrR family transcriptional regulator [Rhodococcus fascians]MBY4429572.1 TetR/AcrR family transcriptional regulator [Rhodococcus fascians]
MTVLVNDPLPERPVGLRERAKQLKMSRIKEAAEQLFRESAFEAVTTKQIAERAQVGEATLFRYVSSKKELLLLIYADRMERLLERIEHDDRIRRAGRPGAADGNAFCRRVYSVYRVRSDFYREDPVNAAIYLREGFEEGSRFGNRSVEQGDRLIRLTTDILREGQQSGALTGSVDARLVAQNCHGIFLHEVDRTPVRGFATDTIWDRVHERLVVQLEPLIVAAD